jgi:hypothetical protein
LELVMIVDIEPGKVIVREAAAVLGIVNDVTLTPDQARLVAESLDREGSHTVAAEGLRRAADQAENRLSTTWPFMAG